MLIEQQQCSRCWGLQGSALLKVVPAVARWAPLCLPCVSESVTDGTISFAQSAQRCHMSAGKVEVAAWAAERDSTCTF